MTGSPCPTCGRVFESRRGLGVHHSAAHDQRLPNRECSACGTSFYSEHEQKYCSEACREANVSREGEANPNYRGGKTETTCETCGRSFEYYPSEKEGVYCPECVETTTWQETPRLTGEENPRWNGGPLELECVACGDAVERYPSDVTGDVTLCGRECFHDWLSETFDGSGHPNWRGGGAGNYGQGWNETRRNALQRDGRRCVLCGTTKEEIGRNPDVHHIVPVRLFERSKSLEAADAHFQSNVASLCPPCHRRAEFGNVPRELLWTAVDADREAYPPALPVETGASSDP